VQHAPTNTGQSSRTNLIRKGLILVLLVLAFFSVRLVYQRQHPYSVEVFTTSGGWGYSILNNGKPFIHQPTIPGQPGLVGFASKADAQRVGERVVEKIQQDKAMPTLTNDELRQLGVKIP
jgi:hypothetical protein